MRKLTSIGPAALLTLGAAACQNEEPMDDLEDTMTEEMDEMDDGEEM